MWNERNVLNVIIIQISFSFFIAAFSVLLKELKINQIGIQENVQNHLKGKNTDKFQNSYFFLIS